MRQMRVAIAAGTFPAWRHTLEAGPIGAEAETEDET